MGNWKLGAALMLGVVVSSFAAIAGQKEDAIIAKTVAAYGGDKLLKLETARIKDHHKRVAYGQAYDPSAPDIVENILDVAIDFKNNRKSMWYVWRYGEHKSSQERLFDGEKGYRINHTSKTYNENRGTSFASADMRRTIHLDTIVVRLLNAARSTAEYLGDGLVEGETHYKIKFQADGYPEMTVFLDPETGYLTKMTRPDWIPEQEYSYHYYRHKKQDGIVFAQDTNVIRGGQPAFITIDRSIDVGADVSSRFTIPEKYTVAPATLAFSEMEVKELAEGMYLAGQDWGFSLFLDVGDHFVAVGGYDDLTKRYEAMKAFSGVEKPLKYQIVTHNHWDHLGGMKEAADLGVTFITVKEHMDVIRKLAKIDLPDNRFILVDGKRSFFDDRVVIHDVPTGHASHNLMPYFRDAKLLFTADHFLSRSESGAPNGSAGLRKLNDKLKATGLDIQHYAAAHSFRVLTADDMVAAINNIVVSVCPTNWEICAD